jgi:endonuclease/exonuclease/phosphatase family metal-dependent hydrolase
MRIATFNVESLDLRPKAVLPISERIRILRPQIERLDADILCLQEVNGQRAAPHEDRQLLALDRLLETTKYETYTRVSTTGGKGQGAADVHNLVILTRFDFKSHRQIRHELVRPPDYRRVTAEPPDKCAQPINWDRPALHAEIALPGGRILHVFNLHLRAPLAVPIPGGKSAPFVWNSVGAWAEGFFLADMMRAGQALEVRLAVEQLLDEDGDALIMVCGDFNAQSNQTPVKILLGTEEDTGNGRLGYRALVSLERSIAHDRRFSVLHHGGPQMVDHILVSRALLASYKQLEIHNETLGDELVGYAKTDKPPDSYHAPLVAIFSSP